ncbi:MAG: M36 family metallopeptidase [Ilumatobacteraceae bacterium]
MSRDNANQITLNDGIPGITNMYLWQPIAGAFYPPCVDGDYDMSVIGHEYAHAISNRMVGGPDANLSGPQSGAMGESWSDLNGMEYLNEYNFVPTNGESPYTVGSYVTGNLQRGIRNYNMDGSPLNYSDVGYDFVCNGPLVGPPIEEKCPDGRTQVHADGEIWSATNFAIRQALITKYNGSFPASNATLQRDCADGKKPADLCPGNRRWVQIVFDAFLLQQGDTSMLDARDAYLAADVMRFGGANQKELWREFARRGMGINAVSATNADVDPIPSFESTSTPTDYENEKVVTFRAFDADNANAPIKSARVFVGRFEAAVTPIADTRPSTPSPTATARFVTGSYEFVVQAPGYGHVKFPRFFTAGRRLNLDIYMSRNRASSTNGAVAVGTGDPTTVARLIDDTEATNWVGGPPAAAIATVDLEGTVQNVKRVNVSAMLNPDSGGRFTALRAFEIWACNSTIPANANCVSPTSFTKIRTSPGNAFPGVRPRPTSPDLILRSFDVTDTSATHVQLRVLTNQCTAPRSGFRGEQDSDPLNNTDCVGGSDADLQVRTAELQVFSSTPALPPQDPAVVVTMTAPTTATSGSNISYTTNYTNLGPAASSNAVLTDVLPAGLIFVSASNGGSYNAATRTVSWALGTVNVGFTGTRTLTARVSGTPGTVIVNKAVYTADLTAATPAAAITTIVP